MLSGIDPIFIPNSWFDDVKALEPFNLLVNYWWDATTGRGVFHD